ncbi:hypothetical protein C2E23DRAFT_901735 [Lenzites betulinus]|nr:hypothetical protein C2E23DRAFT_901735 [Lenzites betulinus]
MDTRCSRLNVVIPSNGKFALDVDGFARDYTPNLPFRLDGDEYGSSYASASDLIDWSLASAAPLASDPWAESSDSGSDNGPPSLIVDAHMSESSTEPQLLPQDWAIFGDACDAEFGLKMSTESGTLGNLHGDDIFSLHDNIYDPSLESQFEEVPFSSYVHDSPQSPAGPVGQERDSSPAFFKRSSSVETDPPKKKPKRRQQDTTRKYACPFEGCDAEDFARRNNLKAHIDSVHEGVRPFACAHGACRDRFARRHDAVRHYQSKHTTLGSPRRKPARRE